MALPPTRPAFLMLPDPAIPNTTVHRITAGMSILMRLMNPSATGCMATPAAGKKCPSKAPSTIMSATQLYSFDAERFRRPPTDRGFSSAASTTCTGSSASSLAASFRAASSSTTLRFMGAPSKGSRFVKLARCRRRATRGTRVAGLSVPLDGSENHSARFQAEVAIVENHTCADRPRSRAASFAQAQAPGSTRHGWSAGARLVPGRLVDLADQRCADPADVLLVGPIHGRLPGRALLGGQRDELALAGALHGGQGVLVVLLRDLVGVGGGGLQGAFQLAADACRQAAPERLVHDDGVAEIAVVGEGHVLLHLVHPLRVEVRRWILDATHAPGLQRLVDLREGHDLRDGSHRAHLRVEHPRGLDAQLLTLEVGGRPQRLVGAHHLEAVVPVREALDALGLELVEQLLADGSLRDLVQLLVAVEDEREVEELELLHAQRGELGERGREHLDRAELQRLQLLLVLVELAVRIDLDPDPALGGLLRELLEAERGLALRRLGRHHVTELDHDGRSFGQRCQGQDQRRSDAEARPQTDHGPSRCHLCTGRDPRRYCGDPQPSRDLAGVEGPVSGAP